MFLGQTYPLYSLGRWDEALAQAAEVPDDAFSQTRFPFVCFLGNSILGRSVYSSDTFWGIGACGPFLSRGRVRTLNC